MQQKNKIKAKEYLYPKKPSGKLYTRRKWLSYALLVLLFTCPFVKFNGDQLVLLNFLERKFVFFGLIFTPQDFYLFALAMLVFAIFILCFTVVLGRLWCGWACPQTIFMEMVFRRIEYWIEGDANKQKKLDAQGWDAEKFLKKGIKHVMLLMISFLIANTFLAYIISSEVLFTIITEPIRQHISGFISICLFTIIFYSVFAHFREVVCTVICPYGRLQGVLLDKRSLVVAYDFLRGEPKGRLRKESFGTHKGDCIDCRLCVQVCPTGIDIRNGTQAECINCTACIDACDAVMLKINKPSRLIGFYNKEFLQDRKAYQIGFKSCGYAAVLFLVIIVFSSLIYKREDIETTVLRASGTLFQERKNQETSNLYNAQLINKTNRDMKFQLKSKDLNDKIEFIQDAGVLPKEGSTQVTFFLIRKNKTIKEYKSEAVFEVLVNGKVVSEASTSFFAQPE